MIEGVEKLGTELALDALRELKLLAERSISVEETRAEEPVPGRVAEGSGRRPAPGPAGAAISIE